MQTIRLNVDALEVRSFATTREDETKSSLAGTGYVTSAVSETDGVFNCKSCGPCCV